MRGKRGAVGPPRATSAKHVRFSGVALELSDGGEPSYSAQGTAAAAPMSPPLPPPAFASLPEPPNLQQMAASASRSRAGDSVKAAEESRKMGLPAVEVLPDPGVHVQSTEPQGGGAHGAYACTNGSGVSAPAAALARPGALLHWRGPCRQQRQRH